MRSFKFILKSFRLTILFYLILGGLFLANAQGTNYQHCQQPREKNVIARKRRQDLVFAENKLTR